MTDKERELLTAMAARENFTNIEVLQYYHPPLQEWTIHQLFPVTAKLIRDGLVSRAFGNPGRKSLYRITVAGREALKSWSAPAPTS